MSPPAIDQSTVQINFKPTAVSADASSRIVSLALAIPALGSIIAIAAFLFVAIQRIPYPYELEWLESGMLEHARRLNDGLPLYTQPSISFTQFPYAPLSFVVSAIFTAVFGAHYWVIRSVSFFSTIGVFALIFWLVNRETKSKWASFIAVGVYAGTYKLTGTWFDIGKADDLFMFVTLAAVGLTRSAETKKMGVLAGVTMAAAILTKQTAVFAFAPLALYLLATRRQTGVAFLISGIAVTAGVSLVWNAVSHGWFNYYVWELLFQHPLITTSKFDFFRIDLKPFWPVAVLALVALPQLFTREKRWGTGFWIIALGGLVAGAWSSRLHSGGSFNVLIPAFAAVAIALGIAMGTLLEKPKRVILVLAAVVMCCSQLWFLRYTPTDWVPSATDRQTGDQFISWLKTVDGDVLIYSHPTYAVMAGKPDFASQGGTEDVLRGKNQGAKNDFENSINNAIYNHRFAAIILDGPEDTRGFPSNWLSYYQRLPGSAVTNNNAWKPIDLNTGHPQDVYVPIGTNNIKLPLPGPDPSATNN